ncbi:MAG TPA: septum site-determining protein MinD [Firmicutes bacterium]|nr:septum site-determining protein MinD [Bacillota bacterium]
MEGRALVITSGKGGVGKTTTVANLGIGLAMLGRQVVMVDADIGLRNLDIVMGLENRIVYDIVNVTEGKCKIRQALIRDKRFDNLFLLPAAQSRDKDAVTPDQMKALLTELKKEFDYILIDCPAGIEGGFKNAIAGADKAIIVTTPEVSAVRDADRIVGLLEASDLPDPRLIVNRVKIDMVRRGDMLDIRDILDILSIELLGIVPEDENIIVSTNRGEPVILDDGSRASQAFRNITRRLEGEEVPFMSLEPGNGFIAFIKRLMGLAR